MQIITIIILILITIITIIMELLTFDDHGCRWNGPHKFTLSRNQGLQQHYGLQQSVFLSWLASFMKGSIKAQEPRYHHPLFSLRHRIYVHMFIRWIFLTSYHHGFQSDHQKSSSIWWSSIYRPGHRGTKRASCDMSLCPSPSACPKTLASTAAPTRCLGSNPKHTWSKICWFWNCWQFVEVEIIITHR